MIRWVCALLVSSTLSCGSLGPSKPVSPRDQSPLEGLLRSLPVAEISVAPVTEIRIDPRVFGLGDRLVVPSDSALVSLTEREIRDRRRTIEGAGFSLTDAVVDHRCHLVSGWRIWVSGTPEPTPECQLDHLSIAIGSIRSEGPSFPGFTPVEAGDETVTIRVVALGANSHFVVDISMKRGDGGAWERTGFKVWIGAVS
jgi:hypothetical protein